MGKNKTLQDIHWLLSRLYISTENEGGCADNIPEFKTLCERYGISFNDLEEAEKTNNEGIG